MSEQVHDFLGNPITGGDYIVYPVRQGSAMWLKRLHVSKVTGGKDAMVQGFNDKGTFISIKNLRNVIVVTSIDKHGAPNAGL